MATQKTLYILRHAKTEIGASTQQDHDRRLTEQGEKAAQIMGAYLFKQGIRPDKILCSDAVRTRQTWKEIEQIYHQSLNVEYSGKLYLASANEIIQSLSSLPDAVKSVMVIGHNPGMHQLALKLAKGGEERLIDEVHMKYPTCALSVIQLDEVRWEGLLTASGKLVDFVTPKMLAGMEDD